MTEAQIAARITELLAEAEEAGNRGSYSTESYCLEHAHELRCELRRRRAA